jgi:hypothetical protein
MNRRSAKGINKQYRYIKSELIEKKDRITEERILLKKVEKKDF